MYIYIYFIIIINFYLFIYFILFLFFFHLFFWVLIKSGPPIIQYYVIILSAWIM